MLSEKPVPTSACGSLAAVWLERHACPGRPSPRGGGVCGFWYLAVQSVWKPAQAAVVQDGVEPAGDRASRGWFSYLLLCSGW